MEQQRIGSSSQPLEGAGFDPAFIPGLTAPVSGREEGTRPGKDDRRGEPEESNGTVNSGSSSPEARDAVPGPEDAPQDAAEEDPAAVPDGPVFEASDRRATIVADHRGVRLRLDDQECEFRWDEIGAVETETARFGKRYTVTVHTPDRRWYPIEIEAPARSRFAEWDEQLDAVLDVYFDDGESDAEKPEAADGAEEADGTGSTNGTGSTDGAEVADGDAESGDKEKSSAEEKSSDKEKASDDEETSADEKTSDDEKTSAADEESSVTADAPEAGRAGKATKARRAAKSSEASKKP
ncbi:hypothetical protein [Streptomyces sp. enrichment culture]|uniref:hypothetical protein n=1 Tax=Streptomyces sp. enrichment culture TaxID=1795815 RepID=UPI003F57A4B0